MLGQAAHAAVERRALSDQPLPGGASPKLAPLEGIGKVPVE